MHSCIVHVNNTDKIEFKTCSTSHKIELVPIFHLVIKILTTILHSPIIHCNIPTSYTSNHLKQSFADGKFNKQTKTSYGSGFDFTILIMYNKNYSYPYSFICHIY